jgi:hypothetical protein
MTQEPPQSNLDLELLAAHLRRSTDDLSLYSGMLLNVLSATLPPDLVEVRREGKLKARLARRDPAVLGISVSINEWRYDLDRDGVGARPVLKMVHHSGGVVMSSKTVSVGEWCRGLATDLAKVAGTNSAAIEALQRLTTG